MRVPLGLAMLCLVAALLHFVPGAVAHIGGGGELVEGSLAVPPWVLWGAGGLVVAGSFVLVASFQGSVGAPGSAAPREVGTVPLRLAPAWHPDPGLAPAPGAPRLDDRALRVVRGLGMLLWLLAWLPLAVPSLHPVPRPQVLLWVLFWAALPLAIVVFGDVWAWLDPFRTMGRLVHRLRPETSETDAVDPADAVGRSVGRHRRQVRFARSVGLIGLLGAIALELVLATGALPGAAPAESTEALASGLAVLGYSLFTFLMMFVFGPRFWLEHGETFGRWARAWAALRMRVDTAAGGVRWGWPGRVLDVATMGQAPREAVSGEATAVGTLRARDRLEPLRVPGSVRPIGDLSGVRDDGVDPRFAPGVPVGTPSWVEQAFVVAMLVGVNYDTLMHAPLGAALAGFVVGPFAPSAQTLPLVAPLIVLLLAWTGFLVVWLWSVLRMRDAAEDREPSRFVGASFVAVLLPIALGYHVAHNLPQVLASLPRFLPAAWVGDELALNGHAWGPRMLQVWSIVQVVAILGGHLLAVWIGHALSRRRYASAIQAFRAEIPLTLVMVVYTLVGLGLLGAAGGAT